MVEGLPPCSAPLLDAGAAGRADYRRNPSFSISARYLSGWVLLK